MPTELPTLSQLFEEHIERVLERLRRRASLGFQAELEELLRFHRFLLAAGSSDQEVFAGTNIFEVSGTAWYTPHDQWTRQYRRIFEGAVELIGIDDQFLIALSHVLPTLMNGDDGIALTPGVTEDLLRLGPMLMHAVEEWVSRRTAASASGPSDAAAPTIGRADRRALEHALPRIVGAWEEVLAASRLGLRLSSDRSAAARWEGLRANWSTMRAHLRRTAYCVAVAVWHGDEIGARLFAGTLRRWPGGALNGFSGSAEYRFGRLLMPDLLDMPWEEAVERVEPLRWPHAPRADPDALFAKLVQGAKRDIELMTAALLASWTATGRTPSALGPRIARGMLDREDLEDDGGAPSQSRNLARTTYDLLRLHAAGERHRSGTYGSWLDEVLRSLEATTEGPAVPNRFKSSPALLDRTGLFWTEAALLATSPIIGGNLAHDLEELAQAADVIPGGDGLLRDVVGRLDGWIEAITGAGEQVRKGAEVLDVWSTDHAALVAVALAEGRNAIEGVRKKRLLAAVVAPQRVEVLRQFAEEAMRAGDHDLGLFHLDAIHFDMDVQAEEGQAIETRLVWHKGNLTEPELAYPVVGASDVVGRAVSTALTRVVTRDFAAHPRQVRQIETWISDPDFWRQILAMASEVGATPTLLIDHREVQLMSLAPDGSLAELEQTFNAPTRKHLEAYRRTIEGVHVLGGDLGEGVALLFSGRALKKLSAMKVTANDPVSAIFQDDESQAPRGTLTLGMAIKTQWSTTPVIELRHDRPIPTIEPPAADPPRTSLWQKLQNLL